MRTKALSPNDKIGRHQTTQHRVMPPKMPKRIRDITKMKATQHRIIGNAILPGTNKAYTKSFQLNA